jgi:hypothetical protein
MQFADLFESRKRRGRAVLIAIAFAAMLIATLVWLSSRFNMDELYGILD